MFGFFGMHHALGTEDMGFLLLHILPLEDREYEQKMISRAAGGEVCLSTANTGMVHDRERVLEWPALTSGMGRMRR